MWKLYNMNVIIITLITHKMIEEEWVNKLMNKSKKRASCAHLWLITFSSQHNMLD